MPPVDAGSIPGQRGGLNEVHYRRIFVGQPVVISLVAASKRRLPDRLSQHLNIRSCPMKLQRRDL
jgi:hypothetical protein